MAIKLGAPETKELRPRITVLGVGGAGGNAVNNMISAKLEGVDFIVANTDAQALHHSKAERRIQIGARITEGLGAGAKPDVGRAGAEESLEEILEQSLTGERLGPDGNNHPDMCPHGCYPCAHDSWISVAVADDAEWSSLCDVLGATGPAGDPRYATMAQRRDHSAALDADLASFTHDQDAEQLAQRLRAAGVAAAKSATALDVIADQRLWDRGLYRFVSDHREGQRPVLGPSWRMARAPARIERGAPDLGEDNDYVLHEILGSGSPAEAAGSRPTGGT